MHSGRIIQSECGEVEGTTGENARGQIDPRWQEMFGEQGMPRCLVWKCLSGKLPLLKDSLSFTPLSDAAAWQEVFATELLRNQCCLMKIPMLHLTDCVEGSCKRLFLDVIFRD